jgi:acetyl-CoA C-acetyltransferase
MSDAVILSACRTAIGTAFRGSLTETTAFDLAEVVVTEALRRSGLDASDIDDVVLGESLYGGGVIGRYTAVAAGMTDVPGVAVNRHCATGLAAVEIAAGAVAAGMNDATIAGGVNSASTSPKCSYRTPGTEEWVDMWLSPTHPERTPRPRTPLRATCPSRSDGTRRWRRG